MARTWLQAATRGPVPDSKDLWRVLNLPWREPPDLKGAEGQALVELVGGRLARRDPEPCDRHGRCVRTLHAVQAWALWELGLQAGLLAPIGVGHGKTGLDLLAPLVVKNCRRAVLLVPAMRGQIIREYLAWRPHFRLPSLVCGDASYVSPGEPTLHVVTYPQLSRAGATVLLERLEPDLIIADEAHKLRHLGTSTAGRVARYLAAHPGTRVAAWSGTLTSRSLRDYSHLAAWTLRHGSPLPLDPEVVEDWAAALDPGEAPSPPGALVAIGGEDVRAAFRRRLITTPGVVSTPSSSVSCSLVFRERVPPSMPARVSALLADVRATMTRPDGEEFVDPASVARCARELACGFFYRWVFPRHEPEALIMEWFAARRLWAREVRAKLLDHEPHLDSPLLLAKAAARAWSGKNEHGLPEWRAPSWPRWRDVAHSVRPQTEAVWVDRWLAEDAAAWARETPGVVWYEHDAFGREVARLAGLPLHGGGPGDDSRLLAEEGRRSAVVSIRSHGTGRDGMQHLWCRQLIANDPVSAEWEQLLGRLHRIGQAADEVEVELYRHVPELVRAFDDAVDAARYVSETTGSPRKLLQASFDFAP